MTKKNLAFIFLQTTILLMLYTISGCMITKSTNSQVDCQAAYNEYQTLVSNYINYDSLPKSMPKNELLVELVKAENAVTNCLLKAAKAQAETIRNSGYDPSMPVDQRIDKVRSALTPCSTILLIATQSSSKIDRAEATKRFAQTSLCVTDVAVILRDDLVCNEAKALKFFENHQLPMEWIGGVLGHILKNDNDPQFFTSASKNFEKDFGENHYKICLKEVQRTNPNNQNIQCYTGLIILILPLLAILKNKL
ncbi:MAG: hypothetical protein N3E37_01605 [Candidatus Micrarchaeota archaeon]|nr:hypothetical protein [Candidatus Micrarchaeota archaeon]